MSEHSATPHPAPTRFTRHLLAIAAAVALSLVAMAYLRYRVVRDTAATETNPTVLQILRLTLSLVPLLVVLLAVAVVLRLVNPHGKLEAWDLPAGAISAVIALTLLMLFSLSSIYVYKTTRDAESQGIISAGLTRSDIRALPDDRFIKVSREPNTRPVPYRATLTEPNATSAEAGRTTLATISTLLVAIVGFYSGQRASERGTERGARLRRGRLADGVER